LAEQGVFSIAGEVYMMTRMLAHGISTDMNYPTLIVLFVIVLTLWFFGRNSPKIRHLRVSAVISFILLFAAAGLDKLFPAMTTSSLVLALMNLIMGPSFSIVFWIYVHAFPNVTGENDSFWVCILVFSFVINTFVIFWITRLVLYIWKKCFTSQADAS